MRAVFAFLTDTILFLIVAAIVLYALFLMTGCAAEKSHTLIPKECMGKIDIQDFTKPCKPLPDGMSAMCDGVRIKYFCVRKADYMKFPDPNFEPNDDVMIQPIPEWDGVIYWHI